MLKIVEIIKREQAQNNLLSLKTYIGQAISEAETAERIVEWASKQTCEHPTKVKAGRLVPNIGCSCPPCLARKITEGK